ncbi:MAG: ion channel [Bacteroidota bacterium]
MAKKHKSVNDPGLGVKYRENTKRIINKDGSFNVVRKGFRFNPRNTYQALITMSWSRFFLLMFAFLFAINCIFAGVYTMIGVEHLSGALHESLWSDFNNSLFFSFQTFTTVGYGRIAPNGTLMSFIAAIESIIGLMCFALITGLLYGRFSKPSARLLYSDKLLIAPYKDLTSLQFRVANRRRSTLMEMEATVMLMTIEMTDGQFNRNYQPLKIETPNILFFPLNWTIVHPIDEKSPLFGKSKDDLMRMNAEVMILIKGFDETFSQVVHSRFSYLADEIEWGARFKPAYFTSNTGDIVFNIHGVHEYEKVVLDS